MCAAFLSRPAARPTRLRKREAHRGRPAHRRRRGADRRATPVRWRRVERARTRRRARARDRARTAAVETTDRDLASVARAPMRRLATRAMIPLPHRSRQRHDFAVSSSLAAVRGRPSPPLRRFLSHAQRAPAVRRPRNRRRATSGAPKCARSSTSWCASTASRARTLTRWFRDVRYQPKIIEAMAAADRRAAEMVRVRAAVPDPARIDGGVAFWRAHARRARARASASSACRRRSSSRSSASRRSTAATPATTG